MTITTLDLDGCPRVEVREQFQEPGSVVITVTGELDHLTETVFDQVVSHAWNQWPDEVIVDLRAVTFLNARGLATLLRASHTARQRRLPLRLWCLPGLAARMVVLVGLGHLMQTDGADPEVSTVASVLPLRVPTPVAVAAARPQVRAVGVLHPVAAAGQAGMVALIELDRSMAAAGADLEVLLGVVLSQLRDGVCGAEHSSFTRGHRQRLLGETTSNSPTAITLAGLQQRTHQGPARDSQRLQRPVHSPDLRCDTRWPHLIRSAAEEAVRSLLTLPLVHEGRRLGVLTLHSDRPDAFTADSRALAGALAARAGTGLGNAHVRDGLQKALASRDVIGQGKGILMARHAITAHQAFEVMTQHSQHTNTPLVDVAEALTRTGDL